MKKFLFVLTRGLEDPTRVTRTLQLAKVAREDGNAVAIFLTDDAVVLAKQDMADYVAAPSGDEAATYLSDLVKNEVPFYV